MAVEDSLDIFGSDPFGRDYLYGLSTGRDGQGLAPYGTRYAENLSQPTTAKRGGYFGNIGTINDPMTEFSSAFEVGGRTVQYPLIVPTLTADELNLLRSGGEPTQEIYGKAQQYALGRLSRGQDPFATPQELRYPQPQAVDTRPYDQMQATPRGFTSGLFSDAVNLPLQYMSSPERTQQMQGAAQFLYGTGIPKTLERISYGDSLFSGSGMTLRPKEETINAAMNVAPFAPAVGRLASRAVKATEGMPVGMGIKDISPKIGINVNQGGSSFADKIISGEKKFETRESDSLRSYVGKRVGIIRTGEGKAKAIGDVTLGEPIVVSSPEEFAKLRDLHLVPEGSKFDIKEGGVKYLYPIENPVPYGVEKDVAKYGIVSRKILGEPDTLEKALYPQQAALDLAQQRAALPVEQGGLGLPVGNTPMDRAKAMGTDVETSYIHSTSNPITKINEDGKFSGIFTLPNYSANYGTLNMPLVARGKIATSDDLRRLVKRPTKKMQMAIDERIPDNVDVADATVEMQKLRNELARKYGFSGVKVSDEFGQDTIALVNPEQIRSRFAAFDPFRKDVATATAMGVALPDLLAQPVNQYQPTYETIPMYTDPFGNTIGSSIR